MIRIMSLNSVKLAIYKNVPPIHHSARLKIMLLSLCVWTRVINRTNQTSGQYYYLFYKHSLYKTTFCTTDHTNILCLNTLSL